MNIEKLSQEPWESVTCLPAGECNRSDGGYESWGESPWQIINGPPQHISDAMLCRRVFKNPTDTQFMALCRSDLGVKLRRGWHTEKCTHADQWVVPQAVEEIMRFTANHPDDDNAATFEAVYQDRHDVGLLTMADAWFRENIDSKQPTA